MNPGRFRNLRSANLEIECLRAAMNVTRATVEELTAVLDIQRPIVRETSMLRSEFDRHARNECDCATPYECDVQFRALARKVWPVRPPAILTNTGRG